MLELNIKFTRQIHIKFTRKHLTLNRSAVFFLQIKFGFWLKLWNIIESTLNLRKRAEFNRLRFNHQIEYLQIQYQYESKLTHWFLFNQITSIKTKKNFHSNLFYSSQLIHSFRCLLTDCKKSDLVATATVTSTNKMHSIISCPQDERKPYGYFVVWHITCLVLDVHVLHVNVTDLEKFEPTFE